MKEEEIKVGQRIKFYDPNQGKEVIAKLIWIGGPCGKTGEFLTDNQKKYYFALDRRLNWLR